MFLDENSGFLADPKLSHCPRPKQSKTMKKQYKASLSITGGSQSTDASASSVSTASKRIPNLPPQLLPTSSNPFLPQMS